MMSAKFSGFLTPSPLVRLCQNFGPIYSTKITQPPLICLLLGQPLPTLGADVLYEWSLIVLGGGRPRGPPLAALRRRREPRGPRGEGRDHPCLVLCPVVVVPEGVARALAAVSAARHRGVERLPLKGRDTVKFQVIATFNFATFSSFSNSLRIRYRDRLKSRYVVG